MIHDSIGRTYAYVEDQNHLYYVSGYYEGGNLQIILDKRGRVSELEA